jgi:hypothetical protein
MNSKNAVPIVVHKDTKALMDKLKEVEYESYDHLIYRALKVLEENDLKESS